MFVVKNMKFITLAELLINLILTMKKITFFKNGNRHEKKWQGKMLFVLICMLSFNSALVRGQAASYNFTQEVGTYQENSSAATALPSLLADTAISGALNIGFSFVYEGVTYTQFKAASDGYITFNMATTGSLLTNNFTTANATSRPMIAPLWDDLDGRATGGSVASYELTGEAPNRVLTMEWRNWEWNYNSASPVISFQVKLYETTNVIEFVYRPESGAVTSGSASIGMSSATGSGTGSFLNVTSLTTLAVSSTTSTTNIATKPVAGQILRFTAPSCVSPSALAAANPTVNSANLSWTSTGNLFNLVWGRAGFTPGGAGSTAVDGLTATSYSLTGLEEATAYEFYVRRDCGNGDLSNWSGPVSFSTTQTLIALPYSEDFEGANVRWAFVNGTQANKWHVGTAASSGGTKGMYISNDNGVTNAYTVDGEQVSQAYKDIAIPAGTQSLDLSFDWRAVGEGFPGSTRYDYISVWLVPTSFTPTAGTQIGTATGRVRVVQYLNNQAEFAQANYVVDASTFTSGSARLVFEWRNDLSLGTQPPAAIDNVEVKVTSCPVPTALAATGATGDSANLSWTSTGNLFDVAWGVTGFLPGGTGSTLQTGITSTSYALTGLQPATNYQFYVRRNCGTDDTSLWVGPFAFKTTQILSPLPYNESFEGVVGWEFSNGATNKWVVGNATSSVGNRALYISNDSGATNAYTVGTTQTSHAFKDIEIPSGTQTIDLSFDWKALGEGFTTNRYDYVSVWLVPTTFTPAAGTTIPTATGRVRVVQYLNNQVDFTQANYVVDVASFTTGTARLVFQWTNDFGGGDQPPGAIDNLLVKVTSCAPPAALTATNPTPSSVDLSWTSSGTSFTVAYGPIGFTPEVSEDGMVSVTGTQTTLGGLSTATPYQYYVRQDCGAESSIWTGPLNFVTSQVVATLPFNEDFESSPIEWTFLNGNQANKWVSGTDPNNGGTSIYISNDGVTNAYVNTASVVHAFRDIQIPAGTTNIDISFDWRGAGQLCCDYVRAWIVPITFTPTAGTQIVVANGKKVGANFNVSVDFTTYEGILNVADYAGQTVRLVFEWTNDGSTFTQPAGAIDNVAVSVTSCDPVTNLGVGTVTMTSAELTWTSAGTAFDVEWGTTGFTLGSGSVQSVAGATSLVLQGLTDGVYQFYVRQDCGTGTSVWAGPFAFTIGYCRPVSSNTSDYITNFVTTGALTNITHPLTAIPGGNGYASYRDMIIEEAQGESFDFSTTYVGGSNRIKIWVDWNNNGSFETTELLFNLQSTAATKTGSIAIPASTPVGDYVIRVRSRFSTTDFDACESYTYGDARDYTLRVSEPLGLDNPNKMASFKFYPNPVANVLNLSYEGEITNVAVFNMLGQQVITKSINASSGLVDMSNLAAGNYIVKVNADGMTKTIKVVKQ